jgi:hypothetical protein
MFPAVAFSCSNDTETLAFHALKLKSSKSCNESSSYVPLFREFQDMICVWDYLHPKQIQTCQTLKKGRRRSISQSRSFCRSECASTVCVFVRNCLNIQIYIFSDVFLLNERPKTFLSSQSHSFWLAKCVLL